MKNREKSWKYLLLILVSAMMIFASACAGDADVDGDDPNPTDTDGDGVIVGDCAPNNANLWQSVVFYPDGDMDGLPEQGATVTECVGNATTYPANMTPTAGPPWDPCPNNPTNICGGSTVDNDGDGYPASTDCNDGDATVWTNQDFYPDADNDNLPESYTATTFCVGITSTYPSGRTLNSPPPMDPCPGDPLNTCGTQTDADNDGYPTTVDCDDSNPNINPGAAEICDGVDNNCNTQADEGLVFTHYYQDTDSDTYGGALIGSFCNPPAGSVTNPDDCNDNDPNVNPAAAEICDGIDNNCNSQTDEGLTFTSYYQDLDNDTYGNVLMGSFCSQPAGSVTNAGDCNDNNNAINPGAAEICDGFDNNCDTQIDEAVLNTYYQDLDSDGYGNNSVSTQACTAPGGYVTDNTDCNDNNTAMNPGATEICDSIDNNCDTQIDEGLTFSNYYQDLDNDSYGGALIGNYCSQPAGSVTNNDDCNDNNNAINPSATEICDSIDNDCNTQIDEGLNFSNYYQDLDNDTYGGALIGNLCSQPTGSVTNTLDCNDNNPAINPASAEICDGLDNNCDTQIDEGVLATFYQDLDADSFGNNSASTQSCTAPGGYVTDNTDCNDADPAINPSSAEICDAIDNNCNTQIDEGLTFTNYYEDLDSDTYGGALLGNFCSQPVGSVTDSTDCNDADPAINPGVTEICDGLDNNCDTQIDEGVSYTSYYEDLDNDTYGGALIGDLCSRPAGSVTNGTDCDDNDPAINPGVAEICDGLDNNCDTQIDEGVSYTSYYEDLDSDTYGGTLIGDLCSRPVGSVTNGQDCNDSNPAINPGAAEICDGLDNNCDALTDEGVLLTFYQDLDTDGYGNIAISMETCTVPIGYVADNTDCNDTDPVINPGITEICDAIDNNCNTQIDEGLTFTYYYEDLDTDTYGGALIGNYCSQPAGSVTNGTDCNDADASINPGVIEICDGQDNNCNLQVDEGVLLTYFQDLDADSYGNNSVPTQACTAPGGYVTDNTDCNDGNPAINPAASEICDAIDNNCNTQIDEGLTFTYYYEDLDSDTYGGALLGNFCSQPVGSVTDSTDCNDADPAINPGALEICDGFDNNCDTQIDEGVSYTSYYEDLDNDTYGGNLIGDLCSQPPGSVTNGEDCNDSNPAINPGVAEICDGLDNNCDTQIDEGVSYTSYYEDLDNDTYGGNLIGDLCSQPAGSVTNGEDCNDINPAINPAASEICDSIDNNCNSQIDEGLAFINYYNDVDNDTYGGTLLGNFCSQPAGSVTNSDDCNDNNPAINPAASEICDGLDNNCNTQIDEGVAFTTYYEDLDSDTYGGALIGNFCSQPAGSVTNSTDCNDANPAINPGAIEICDGIDNNCDTQVDEGVLMTFFQDLDTDNYGNIAVTTQACTAPVGYVADNTDCDDGNPAINPGASESCDGLDNNCNTQIDEGLTFINYYEDLDSDTYGNVFIGNLCAQPAGSATNGTDCNDADAAINPGATEICDGLDNNCDTQIDEGLTYTTYYEDLDADTYGGTLIGDLCSQPAGSVTNGTDCNDGDSAINPGATEICDGIDNNCDTQIDEGITFTSYYEDLDNDTYGGALIGDLCTQPVGSVINSDDCDDTNPAINPGATEICDAIDNNCNSQIDEGLTFTNYYEDLDTDTYGGALIGNFCSQPAGSVTNGADCDDSNPAINPGATEICDSIDNNCNAQIDEGVLITYYQDLDSDNYGNITVTTQACTAPAGYVADNTDCNDGNSAINPGATEICDGLDNNCNTQIDEGLTFTNYYEDLDSDTYGGNLIGNFCAPPAGSVTDNTDCDDSNPAIYPGAPELCDGVDNNCNTQIDESLTFADYYEDLDSDTYGGNLIGNFCSPPIGGVTDNTDCDDSNPAINPGATEICDGIDNNCDTQIDEGLTFTSYYEDLDSDTYGGSLIGNLCTQPIGSVTNGTDCDDSNPAINPGATEICDGVDNNCNTQIDEGVLLTFYQDLDTDTYGNLAVPTQACTAPVGYVADNTDCDDSNPAINPGATEICDGIDNNCNTQIDEGLTFTSYYEDLDSDTYGGNLIGNQCIQPAGSVTNGTDCDDTNPAINPGATEICDGVDNNCNTQIDEGVLLTFYQDLDTDTYGNLAVPTQACTAPVGYVADNTDCNDSNPAINPGATEICDSIDNNCNTQIDEGLTFTNYYQDLDSDTYGGTLIGSLCSQPAGSVTNGTDCNDGNGTVWVTQDFYPDADNDALPETGVATSYCVGNAPTYPANMTIIPPPPLDPCPGDPTNACATDADGDGYMSTVDCNDGDSAVWQNVDFWLDADVDALPDDTVSTSMCVGDTATDPAGYTSNAPPPLDPCLGDPTNTCATDADGDGYDSSVDCNDGDSTVWVNTDFYPDADNDALPETGIATSYCVGNAPTYPAGMTINVPPPLDPCPGDPTNTCGGGAYLSFDFSMAETTPTSYEVWSDCFDAVGNWVQVASPATDDFTVFNLLGTYATTNNGCQISFTFTPGFANSCAAAMTTIDHLPCLDGSAVLYSGLYGDGLAEFTPNVSLTGNTVDEFTATWTVIDDPLNGIVYDISFQSQAVTDSDSDGINDNIDNCPWDSNAGQVNSDTDSHGDACDNCPFTDNENQIDTDLDGIGDVCEPPFVPSWEINAGFSVTHQTIEIWGDCDYTHDDLNNWRLMGSAANTNSISISGEVLPDLFANVNPGDTTIACRLNIYVDTPFLSNACGTQGWLPCQTSGGTLIDGLGGQGLTSMNFTYSPLGDFSDTLFLDWVANDNGIGGGYYQLYLKRGNTMSDYSGTWVNLMTNSDLDIDGDWYNNPVDTCIWSSNPTQGVNDCLGIDDDNDGWRNAVDPNPTDPTVY